MSPPSSMEDASSSSAGKCPVDHKGGNLSLWKVIGIQSSSPPSTQTSSSVSPEEEEDLRKRNLPASLEEAAKYSQIPNPQQRLPLSTHRAESSIPRSSSEEAETPHHQLGSNTNNWVYPSEQQVFNAMKRKGWKGVEEESIPSFLQIHNSVNERGWRQVQAWESSASKLELVRFEGRPQDLSPKAWLKTYLLFQDPPFDRHDWYVNNGKVEKRYVLDFYMTEDPRSGLPRVDIDTRPALDTPMAFYDRAQRVLMDVFPGITKELQRLQARPSGP